jgi:hypothetical protein
MNNCPFTINFITPHFFYLSCLSLIHFSPNPASSLADRTPPCGGIARPQGKHSRHKGVLCLPAADFRQKSG